MKWTTLLILGFLCIIFSQCSSSNDDNPDTPMDEDTMDPPTMSMYFPPITGGDWETISLETLGWNTDATQALLDFLQEKDSKAFIILKDGRIALEAYFNTSSASSNGPWNSTGKTLSAFTLGIAQEEGFLSINNASSDYLGSGWSSLETAEENEIKVIHHLSMTTGLDYNVTNSNCTTPNCLTALHTPGTFWYYHNAPYTLTQSIISGAVNQEFNSYFNSKLKNPIGMDGTWLKLGFANVYYSTARSMARFGLLNLNEGNWDGTPILSDTNYFNAMTTTSQDMNKAYGYLWWLNGKDSFRAPASELQFPGKLIPNAPDDLIAGLGKDDQKLYVIPSKGLVIVRMGDDTGEALLGPSSFDNELWEKINLLIN